MAASACRLSHMSYWDFGSRAHSGAMVVNVSVVSSVVTVFRTLYRERFLPRITSTSPLPGDDADAGAGWRRAENRFAAVTGL